MLKCNLTEEEKAEIWPLFSDYIPTRELELTKGIFKKYIFYETWGRRNFREYFCPNCGRFEVEQHGKRDSYQPDLFADHHGDSVSCPICGQEGELVCLGRMRSMNSLWQEEKVIFFQERDGKLLTRAGWLTRTYDREDLDPLPEFHEKARYYTAPGKRQMWERASYKAFNTRVDGADWTERKSLSEPFAASYYMMGGGTFDGRCYAFGMERIGNTDMRWCMLEDWLADAFCVDGMDMTEPVRGMVQYLGEYTRKPQMEMLVKLGHHDVVTGMIEGSLKHGLVNWRAKSPHAFFRMTKTEYKTFHAAGANLREYEAWKELLPELPLGEFMEIVKIFGRNTKGFARRFGRDPRRKKLCAWFDRQQTGLREKTWTWWMDTLRSEEMLGNNIDHDHILMPADLRARHDETAAMAAQLQKQREEELVKNYGKVRFRQLKKQYEWTDGTLMIRVPTCAEEIENEGRLLRHCVAGYADRHIKGKTTILFLRWKDDPGTSYMTIEINGADIRQIHGYHNDLYTAKPRDIHGDLLDEWVAWIRQGSPRTSTGKQVRIKTEEVKTA